MTTAPHAVDVVIVGGGLVGGLCALLLAEGGVKPLVIDAAPALTETDRAQDLLAKRDARVWALSPASLSLLSRAKVWGRVQRHAPYQGMQVWSRDGRGILNFGSADHHNDDLPVNDTQLLLGSMVEPGVLSLALQEVLQERLGSSYLQSTRLQSLERLSQTWKVTLADGTQYQTPLVIGADGAGSVVRQFAGIQTELLDYKQMAVTCAIRTEKPNEGIARQVFLPTGPLAFLPLANLPTQVESEHDCWQSVVWTLPAIVAQDMMALDDVTLRAELAHASGYMLGQIDTIESRGIFPLKAQQAKQYSLEGLVLVGDAAHVVHPMAGQGVNLGCLDAAVLVDALLHDRARGLWAHRQTLKRYERARKLPNSIMMHGLSLLGWLQSSDQQWMMWLRGEGMHAVAKLDHLRHLIGEQASGRGAVQGTRYQMRS
ncbi:FAD-dependent monooxygenase [Aquirhabdus parva]|uniref:FAD-dependent monooxygenase n=1 Tax=Aquirhabdus parva TaxID=2283318 RepID=A0A345P587_9GAMM|nr:FAD-dependent monooxygenase [Aquirhabdus parva]AXI02446.1 FAD-dependent monooxygenase [Aquirhabdus parva]